MPEDTPFGAAHAQSYAERARRQVPGLAGLHRIAGLLLAERVPEQGRVLVLGAGGGLELDALASEHAGWRFDGVDPSAEMLEGAKRVCGQYGDRIALHQGKIDAAPDGPFDAAVCLLTFHFIAPAERGPTLDAIRRRLVPGAPFVLAQISFPQSEPERSIWIDRHIAMGDTEPAKRSQARSAIATRLSILSPEEDMAALQAAGFADVSLVFAALTIRGWVGYA